MTEKLVQTGPNNATDISKKCKSKLLRSVEVIMFHTIDIMFIHNRDSSLKFRTPSQTYLVAY